MADKYKLLSGQQLSKTREILTKFKSPNMTTTERDAIITPEDGMQIYNTTTDDLEVYIDGAWLGSSIKSAYPVGSIYTSVVSTNPATLLGFGTWEVFGAGKALVGLDSGDADFDTVEETGGAKTVSVAHTHTGPSHTHVAADHLHSVNITTSKEDNEATITDDGTDQVQVADDNHYHSVVGNTGAADRTLTTSASGTGATGAMSANATPSIVQPYIVVNMWKRAS